MHGKNLSRVVASLTAALLLGLMASPAAAQTGSITGRVTAAGGTAGPLEAARVTVVGTNLGAATNRDGVYTIRGVPPGTYTVRVIRLGFAQRDQSVTVTAMQTVTLDFTLSEAPFTLEEITTTATGEARKLEVGNTINTIRVDALVERAPIRDVSQILAARAPGVQVLPSSGTVGSGNRIRIRGSNSVSLSNEPLFVIDGVRANSGNGDLSFGVGGQSASRLLDINPEEIADIQVLKGPSASAIYGTGGSNGVILITTKRGIAGRAQWNLWAEGGTLEDRTTYPDNYYGATSTGSRCRLYEQAAGSCTMADLLTFNPMRDTSTSPLATGYRQQYGGSVAGGSDAVQYFVSGEWEGERGAFEMPLAEQDRILTASGRAELRPEEIHPNSRSKYNVRANTNFILNPKTSGSVLIGYSNSWTTFPQNDNNVNGIHSSGLNGDGRGGTRAWGFFRPGETFQRFTKQTIDRLNASANANWNPLTWLSTSATLGIDITQRQDQQLQRFGEGPDFSIQRSGFAGEARFKTAAYTANAGGTANHRLTDRITSKTSAGFQYSEFNTHGTNGNGDILPPGSVTVTSASTKRLSEATSITKSAGAYVEEVLGLDERLYLTGSVRFDKNSSTGIEAKTIVYPKAAASYLTPWFEGGTLSSLRLRASYGTAGQQPSGPVALETFFTTTGVLNGADSPGVGLNNFGDPTLKAERSWEVETGFDLGMFDGKVAVELTAFHKETDDALIFVTTPPSLGFPSGQFRNVGTTRNQGLELIVNGQVLNSENLTWDFTVTGSLTKNRLLDMPDQIPFISQNTNNTQQHRGCLDETPTVPSSFSGKLAPRCYPLGGYWGRPYKFNDANGDGILVASEVTMGDSLEYIGPSQPTREATFTTLFGLFKNRIQVSTTLDYHGGHFLWNLQEDFRCRARSNCQGMYDINAGLDQQARLVALTLKGASNSTTGYIEKADYMKWREVSVSYNAPSSWASALGASRMSLTATGRNLATITDYSGLDPEVNGQGEANFAQREFLSIPPLRQFALRVNLTF